MAARARPWIGFLALALLVFQGLLPALPMPVRAAANAGAAPGASALCLSPFRGDSPAADPQPPLDTARLCPVCIAVQMAGTLLPPPDAAPGPTPVVAEALPPARPVTLSPILDAPLPPARAPPAIA